MYEQESGIRLVQAAFRNEAGLSVERPERCPAPQKITIRGIEESLNRLVVKSNIGYVITVIGKMLWLFPKIKIVYAKINLPKKVTKK